MLKLCALAALAAAALLSSGPTPAARADPPTDPVAVARQHLAGRLAAHSADSGDSDFALVDYRESPGGRHVHFQQTIDGLPLSGGYVTVSLGKNNDEVSLVTGRTLANIRPSPATARIAHGRAIDIAHRAVGVRGAMRGDVTAEAVYFAVDSSTAIRAWEVRLPALEPLGDWHVVVSAVDGAVLARSNRMAFDHPAASGEVFDPNPVVSSGAAVPPPSDCDSAENEAGLSDEYFSHTLLGIDSGQGQLVGEYVDLTAPGVTLAYKFAGQANEPSHIYSYPCNDVRFEEVVIYYHVDTTQRLIQSLGFTGASAIRAVPLPAHPHFSVGCNAFYSTENGGYIAFLDGCTTDPPNQIELPVDWAEDADVIIHEYGHALQDDQAAGELFATAEGQGMAEGFADFLVAAVSADPCMFEWPTAVGRDSDPPISCLPSFKNQDFGPFRNLVNDLHYPEDVNTDEHVTGLIWGGALWDMAQTFGGDEAARMKTLTIALQSNFYLNETADFADSAAAVCQADIDLYAGVDLPAIKGVFDGRGIPSTGDVCLGSKGVGGLAELPEVAGAQLAAIDSSGSSAGVLAGAIAGAVLVGGVALGGAAWWARQR